MKKLKNKYYILRHGQTIYQTKKKDWTYPRGPKVKVGLTQKGKNQIKAVAKKLKKSGIDLIYSSDFFRTRQTAKIVIKKLGIKKIKFDKRLREVDLGIYQGGRKEDFRRDFPSGKTMFSKRPKKGESWKNVQKRVLSFLKELERKYKEKTILIIGHGNPLWLLESKVKGLLAVSFIKNRKDNYIQPGELRRF